MEALASARAVITTDLPGCRDAVVDGINGYLVRPRDENDLAMAMMRFAAEPERANLMGKASLALARDVYDVDKVNLQLLGEMGLINSSGVHPQERRPSTSKIPPHQIAASSGA